MPSSRRKILTSLAVHRLLNACGALMLPFLSLVLQSTPEPLKLVCRLLEIYNTGPGDCTADPLELGINMLWTLLWIPLGITCLGISFTMFWRCISPGTSTFMFMYCCCETSVLCCTFWPVLIMYCTCGNFNGLCILWT